MLTSKIIGIAEALAVDTNANVTEISSPVIKLAGSQLNGVLPLTAETYASRLPELANTSEEYKSTMNEVAGIVAENMRVTFDQIGTYAKGLANCISSQIDKQDLYLDDSKRLGANFLMGMLDLEFVRTDHPFFNSLLYPTKVPNTTMSFAQVSVGELNRLKIVRWDTARIVEWLSIDNKEINELLMSSNVDLPNAMYGLFNPWDCPFTIDEKTKTIDYTQPNLNYAELMFVQYIILGKMMADEVPFEGLISGGLEEYRGHITLLFSAYSQALINLKGIASTLVSVPLRIVEREQATVRPFPPIEGSKPYARVRAKAVMYYNAAGLDNCVEAKTTLSEVAAAYFQRKYVLLEPAEATAMVSNVSAAHDFLRRCADGVLSTALDSLNVIYSNLISQAVTDFIISRPELTSDADKEILESRIQEMLNDRNWGGALSHSRHTRGLCTKDAIFDTGLPAVFLKAIGCKDACAILENTIYLGRAEDGDLDRRAHLHEAVINHFVHKFMTAS